ERANHQAMTDDGTVVMWRGEPLDHHLGHPPLNPAGGEVNIGQARRVELLDCDLGDHPLNPVGVELSMALARDLGVLDRPGVRIVAPESADDAALTRVHNPAYLQAVRA